METVCSSGGYQTTTNVRFRSSSSPSFVFSY
uniref:Uncharacterized protein MANES_05G068000 n=1 Tax=Rhizophora mucronata TaxID=61149 RepID=A0A2P2IQQ6_RHIMU